jgi:hypothetical protein
MGRWSLPDIRGRSTSATHRRYEEQVSAARPHAVAHLAYRGSDAEVMIIDGQRQRGRSCCAQWSTG